MNSHRLASTRPAASRRGPLLLAMIALALPAGCRKAGPPPTPPPPVVGVVEAKRMDVPVEATTTGTTRALEEVAIRARVRGFLTEKHFDEGSMVTKGQLLLVIDEVPYQIALQSAKARLAEAEAALTKAEQSKNREVTSAQVALDTALLFLAQVEERRSRTLLSRNAGTREDLDKTEADRKKAEAQVEADRAQAEQAKADYDVGILSARAQIDAAKAAVHDAEVNLSYCRMTAPIEGRIGEAKVKVGNLVGPESSAGGNLTELCSIQQLDPMGIDIRVSSRYLERATQISKVGMDIEVTRPGIDGEVVVPEKARPFFIDNIIDQTTSTFLVRAKLDNPRLDLLPGEYVKLRMVVDQLKDVVVVPEIAVREGDAGPTVFFVDKEGKAAIQSVEAGQAFQGLRVVSKGLEPGTPVIVQGIQLIRPGAPVKAEPAVLPRPIASPAPLSPPGAAPAQGAATKDVPKSAAPGKAAASPDATGAIRPAEESTPGVRPGGPRSAIPAPADATRPADAPGDRPDASPKH
ncbi:efflux RND transporter periplasmic adaptor subunit [Tundrisphaera sp. TA3]|uniref:efflux RND transporter periplasmic adaptor subunit n=1 Tax=Tundrisphaera sp. TA3 TaxID=3435775 RepID=UPI003EBA7CEA